LKNKQNFEYRDKIYVKTYNKEKFKEKDVYTHFQVKAKKLSELSGNSGSSSKKEKLNLEEINKNKEKNKEKLRYSYKKKIKLDNMKLNTKIKIGKKN
jgi:hypothetical protein